jgi:hypothetical protein
MAHKRTSNDDLRFIQPKRRALTKTCMKTATETFTHMTVRRKRTSDGSERTSTMGRSRLALRTTLDGEKA